MFQLETHDAVFSNLNLRKEKHGEDKVPAADMKFAVQAQNTILDTIDPAIRPAFFRKAKRGEQQSLPIDDNDLVALNLPILGKQKIELKIAGYELRIDSLMGHIEPLFFADCKLKELTWEAIEGGSVSILLTVQSTLEDEDAAPLLAAWSRGEVSVTLVPPKPVEQQKDLAA
ncbi:hypothetical protein [Stenotrophomonas sp. B2]|uniref:hypothetical protein n=1 Tax=Stenotrophomonas sp. B2 TaxID=1537778 RepID=UPI001875EE21|nr:hypothetical protein [Stenotrophomonas sp. B2]MBE5272142.1 hypothetical protein [Stenotrophomonas sp. B2]